MRITQDWIKDQSSIELCQHPLNSRGVLQNSDPKVNNACNYYYYSNHMPCFFLQIHQFPDSLLWNIGTLIDAILLRAHPRMPQTCSRNDKSGKTEGKTISKKSLTIRDEFCLAISSWKKCLDEM